MEGYKLIEPLYERVNKIKESLYPRILVDSGEEKIFYGTFEKSYEAFYKLSLREGRRVNEHDYFLSVVKELEEIEDSILQLEERINSEQNNNIKFSGIFSLIHRTIQNSISQSKNLQSFDGQVANIAKPRNRRTLLTYKWSLQVEKLYDLKKFLVKNELIEKIEIHDFRVIFSEKPIFEIKKRIVWKNEIATQLIYLIMELQKAGYIEEKRKNFDYILLFECFQKKKGERFTEKSKSLKNNIEIKISSEFKALVKTIITQLG